MCDFYYKKTVISNIDSSNQTIGLLTYLEVPSVFQNFIFAFKRDILNRSSRVEAALTESCFLRNDQKHVQKPTQITKKEYKQLSN